MAVAGAGYFTQFQLDGWKRMPGMERFLVRKVPLENSARDYLANMKLLEAVYASHAGGRRIELARFNPER